MQARGLSAVLAVLTLWLAIPAMGQAVFFVNSIGDAADINPGNGVCNTGDVVPAPGGGTANECTLRAAIQEINAGSYSSPEIHFSSIIETNMGDHSWIGPQVNLPVISSTVFIRGETHPGFDPDNPRPPVHIFSPGGTSLMYALSFLGTDASGSLVSYISMGALEQDGIQITDSNEITLSNIDFGVHRMSTGTIVNQLIQGAAVLMINSSSTVLLENNITNSGVGVQIGGTSINISVMGNNIGALNDNGDWSERGNNGPGVRITETTADLNYIGRCIFSDCLGNRIVANESGVVVDAGAAGQVIKANLIGVDPAGGTDSGWGNDGSGILVNNDGNKIGDGEMNRANIIGHNTLNGISLGESETQLSNDNTIDFNFIGTLPEGGDVGNEESGIVAWGTDNEILNNQIFNHEDGYGAVLQNGSYTVQGNRIDGAFVGLQVSGPVHGGLIGGLNPGDANVIGNSTLAINVASLPEGVDIQGNYVGTDADGAILENQVGIRMGWTATSNVVVGSTSDPVAGANIIGYSELVGINIRDAAQNVIVGNRIGVHTDDSPIPNPGHGILITGGSQTNPASGNVIGYRVDQIIPETAFPPLGNIIAHSGESGITMRILGDPDSYEARHNSIRGNRMFTNAGGGIRLGEDGEGSVVDPGGSQDGPNRLQNFPEFLDMDTWYNDDTGLIEYSYRVRTNSGNADYPLTIDFYLADGQTDQGEIYLGADQYPASDANAFRTGTLSPPSGVNPAGGYLVATATDQGVFNGITTGNTSQFNPVPISLGEFVDGIFQDRFEVDE